MKGLLSIPDLGDKEEILNLLDLADDIKQNPEKYHGKLKNKCLILIFEKTSTRTRISFENGMYQLGGSLIYLDWRTTNFHLGALADEIKCISLYVDLIMARVYKHRTLKIMQKAANVPIINGLSDKYHPCQALSDLMTIREKFKDLSDIKIAFIGDGNNVCNSLVIGSTMLEIPINVATPENYKPHLEVLTWLERNHKLHLFNWTTDPYEAVKDVDIVYTDTFVSMGQENEKAHRLKVFKSYQINSNLLSSANKNPYIMHCMPMHRGVEITEEVLDSKNSIIFEQAENRMHLQKALILKFLSSID